MFSILEQIITLIRVRQWSKNCFVFLPILFTPAIWNIESVITILLAFVILCLASSLTYILNDYIDIESDRLHPVKKYRPLASGELSIYAVRIVFGLMSIALLSIVAIDLKYLFVLVYLITTTAYTFFLKRILIWDVFAIAMGFLIRTYFGAFILQIEITPWFLMSTVAISIFLGSAKRFQEIRVVGVAARSLLKSYNEQLLWFMMMSSATCAVVFYSLAAATKGNLLILTSIFVIIGIFRYFHILLSNNEESPSEIVLTDNQLQIIVLIWLAITLLALTI